MADGDASQLLFPEKTDALAFPLFHAQPIDKGAEAYQRNVSDWADVLKEYHDGLEWCASQGTKHYEDRHKARGLLLGTPNTRNYPEPIRSLTVQPAIESTSF